MTNRLQCDLDYGQLGDVIYDHETTQWHSQRIAQAASILRPLFASDHANPIPDQDPSQPLREPHRSRVLNDIVALYPHLQPATEAIAECLAEWPVTQDEDEIQGTLLALVNAKEADRSDRHNWDVRDAYHPVLVIRGPGSNDVRFIELIRRRSGWNDDQKRILESWAISDKPSASWTSDGDVVLQICAPNVSRQEDLASTVAVRMPNKIQLFYPKHNRPYAPSTRYVAIEDKSLPTISPCPTHTIPIPSGRGYQYADISYNPWDHNHIAATTTEGEWMVWTVGGSKLKRIARSSMKFSAVPLEAASDDDSISDGWHRITWSDVNHLILCDRHTIHLFDIGGQMLAQWSLAHPSASHIITDICRSPSDEPLVFISSTVLVFLLRINVQLVETAIELAASWHHHLDVSDSSLRLAPYSHAEGKCTITRYECSIAS